MRIRVLELGLLGLSLLPPSGCVFAQGSFSGPWPIEALMQEPAHEWGEEADGVREVYYEGLPFRGQATRVFAYLGIPAVAEGRIPGVVLLHGGGQHANAAWVSYWMARGYAALSMDLQGWGPEAELPAGGPPLNQETIFGPFPGGDLHNGWVYHAVANAILGHSLLAKQPEVDPTKIAVNGLSWGGFLTCIVAGLDHRVRAAAAVYGCGYLHEGSFWLQKAQMMDCHQAAEWALLDPSAYLPYVRCPLLMQSGAKDPFFPPDSYQRSWEEVASEKVMALRPSFDHGDFWMWPWGEVEVNLFVDHHLKGGPAPPTIRVVHESETSLECEMESDLPVEAVYLATTTDTGPWSSRDWSQEALEVDYHHFTVELPASRPLIAFVMARIVNPSGSKGFFSTPYFFRYGVGSPLDISLDELAFDPAGVRLFGRKPRGWKVLIEGTTDFCVWTALGTDSSKGTDLDAFVPFGEESFRVFRARKWDQVR